MTPLGMSLPRMLCEPVADVFTFCGDQPHVRDFLHLSEEQDNRHDQARRRRRS